MIKTSTLSSLKLSPNKEIQKEDPKLPEFEGPSEAAINNILNYSKSLKVMQSEMVRTIEVVNQ